MNTTLKKGVMVDVLSGGSKGSSGVVLSVDRKACRVFVEGVNVGRRSPKKGQRLDSGKSWIEVEMPIHASNVRVKVG